MCTLRNDTIYLFHSTALQPPFPTRSPRLSRRPSNIHHRAGKRAIIRARSIRVNAMSIPIPTLPPPLRRTCHLLRRQCRGRDRLRLRPPRWRPPCRAHHRMTHRRRRMRINRRRRRPPTTTSPISSIREAFSRV